MGGADKLDAVIGGRPLLRWSVEAMAAAAARSRGSSWSRAPERVDGAGRQRPGSRGRGRDRRRRWRATPGLGRGRACEADLGRGGPRPRWGAAARRRPASPDARRARLPRARRGRSRCCRCVDSLKRSTTAPMHRALSSRARASCARRRRRARGASCSSTAFDAAGGPEAYSRRGRAARGARRRGRDACRASGEHQGDRRRTTSSWSGACAGEAGPARRRRALGLGEDSHPFGPGDGPGLGGVLIADAPRLYGHSDGDVVLHALCDGDPGRGRPRRPRPPLPGRRPVDRGHRQRRARSRGRRRGGAGRAARPSQRE